MTKYLRTLSEHYCCSCVDYVDDDGYSPGCCGSFHPLCCYFEKDGFVLAEEFKTRMLSLIKLPKELKLLKEYE